MINLLLRFAIGTLLIVHGLAHYKVTTGWGAQATASSWLLDGIGLDGAQIAAAGDVLWLLTLIGLLTSGVLLLMDQPWWRPNALAAAALSLLTLILFWQPVLVLGVMADVVAIAGLLLLRLPGEGALDAR